MNVQGTVLTEIEVDRESSCRTLPCPNCHSVATRLCSYGLYPSGRSRRCATSHTGRYLAAVAAGLVPPLPGGPEMDELTRERFGPPPLPELSPAVAEVAEAERQHERRRVLLGADETPPERRTRLAALARSRRLARAIATYQVRKSA